MLSVYPDYYNDFKCINKKCRHNCCIGWEIDIDSDTLEFYKSVKGEFGKKLENNIGFTEEAHFILGENERCPFLNNDNLCEIHINLGEENICDICKEHPRFHNELPTRIESGIGLCCEEAARIILSKKSKVKFIINGEQCDEDATIFLRDKIINILQNRDNSIEQRIEEMYSLLKLERKRFDFVYFSDFLLGLERLDEKWTEILCFLKENIETADLNSFNEHMKNRQTEYEQLLVYIIYRHFVNAFDLYEMQSVIRFADFAFCLISAVGAAVYTVGGNFDFSAQTELVRIFSSEIEYSEENLENLTGKLLFI